MKTLKPTMTQPTEASSAWPTFSTGEQYNVGDIFKTDTTPSWGVWEVTKAGVPEAEPIGSNKGDVFISGDFECKLVKLGSGTNDKGIGFWEKGKTYAVDDVIIYKSKIYSCITNNNDDEFDEAKWQEISGESNVVEWRPNTSYTTDDIVKYQNKLYSCVKKHTSDNNFNADLNKMYWDCIGDGDVTAVGYEGGYSQVTKLGVEAPLDVTIGIGITKTFCKPPVEVLKREDGAVNVEEVEATFSADENTNYTSNRFITVDNTLHEVTEVKYKTSLKETIASGKIYESEEIDPSDYKSISEVKV